MISPLATVKAYLAHRADWDSLCARCGRCCYERHVDEEGFVVVDYSAPCPFLDESTRLCTVYETRFETCDRCHKLTPFHAAFSRHLPPDCAYAKAFRAAKPTD